MKDALEAVHEGHGQPEQMDRLWDAYNKLEDTSPNLNRFIYNVAGYAADRSSHSRFGFAHAHNLLDAKKIGEQWQVDLKKGFADLSPSERDIELIKQIALIRADGMQNSPKAKELIDHAMRLALDDKSLRPGKVLHGLCSPDCYGDRLQPPRQKLDFS